MNPFVKFMATTNGRILRIVVGIALIIVGFLVNPNWVGYILIVIGLIPLVAGILDLCFLAPLFGAPIQGAKIRAGK